MPEKPKQDDKAAAEQPAKKKLPIKAMLIVLGLLVAEAVVVVGVVSMGGPPAEVKGGVIDLAPADTLEATGELLIVRDKFPNHSTGRVWLWDLEVQVQVKVKHREHVEKVLDERGAEIKTGISRILRNAHQNHLQEPNLETVTRQFAQYLRTVFGKDPDGEERVQEVLLPQLVGFPADF